MQFQHYPQFFTAAILEWKHLLQNDKYKPIIVDSMKKHDFGFCATTPMAALRIPGSPTRVVGDATLIYNNGSYNTNNGKKGIYLIRIEVEGNSLLKDKFIILK